MMAALARIARSVVGIDPAPAQPPPLPKTDKFEAAMKESGDLIQYFREASNDHHPIRAMMADLWLQRHNVPFVTTTYEAMTEMKSAVQYSSAVARDLNGK
jgi:hypothetical protein